MISKGPFLLLFLLMFAGEHVSAQSTVLGFVKDQHTGIPLAGVSVLLREPEQQKILAVVHTDENGEFRLMISGPELVELMFSAMGYARYTVRLIPHQSGIRLDILLEEASLPLEEIQIQVRKPIYLHGDTVTFDAAHFSKGDERYVEDLLKRIPGIQVAEDGTIRYGHQEIERLMVEGDDFFEKGYRVLSTSMPAYPIDKVQLLKKYSANRAMKGLVESHQIALNLTLKKEYGAIWFGTAKLGLGLPVNKLELNFDLMKFGKQNKHYLINQYNNRGLRAYDLIAHLLKPGTDPDRLGSNVYTYRYLNPQTKDIPGIQPSRANFNNELLGSYNTLVHLNKDWRLKLLSYHNRDRQRARRETNDQFILPDTVFNTRERLDYYHKRSAGFGRIEIEGNPSGKRNFISGTDLLVSGSVDENKLTFNMVPFLENLRDRSLKLDQRLQYSDRIRPDAVVLVDLRMMLEESPQKYTYAAGNPAENLQPVPLRFFQHAAHALQFYGLEGRYIQRSSQKRTLELAMGRTYRSDLLDVGERYFNSLSETYIHGHYTWYPYRHLALSGRAKIRLLADSGLGTIDSGLETTDSGHQHQRRTDLLVDPGFSISWDIGKDHKLYGSYFMGTAKPEIQDRIPVYVVSGYRSALRGAGQSGVGRTSTWTISHQSGDWASGLFFHSIAYFIWHHHHLALNSAIYPDYTLSEKIWVRSPFHFNAQSSIDCFLEGLSSNLKIEWGVSGARFKNQVNGLSLHQSINLAYRAGLQLRSGFSGPLNFHVGARSSLTSVSGRDENDRSVFRTDGFADCFILLGKQFEGKVLYEWYFSDQGDQNPDYLGFLDCGLSYRPVTKYLQMEVVGENLLNVRNYSYSTVSEQGFSNTSFRILPRQMLVRILLRF